MSAWLVILFLGGHSFVDMNHVFMVEEDCKTWAAMKTANTTITYSCIPRYTTGIEEPEEVQ